MNKQLNNIKTTVDNCKECPHYEYYWFAPEDWTFKCHQIKNCPIIRFPGNVDSSSFIHEDCPLKDAREQGVKVGIAIILLNEKDELLVGRRDNATSGNDAYGLPGGGMKAGEIPREAGGRELEEETSVKIIDIDKIEFASFTNDSFMEDSGEHWITLYFLCRFDNWTGEVKRVEPHKCKEWRWVNVNNIPEPFFCDWAREPNITLLKKMIL